jgi:hypothetical protein
MGSASLSTRAAITVLNSSVTKERDGGRTGDESILSHQSDSDGGSTGDEGAGEGGRYPHPRGLRWGLLFSSGQEPHEEQRNSLTDGEACCDPQIWLGPVENHHDESHHKANQPGDGKAGGPTLRD